MASRDGRLFSAVSDLLLKMSVSRLAKFTLVCFYELSFFNNLSCSWFSACCSSADSTFSCLTKGTVSSSLGVYIFSTVSSTLACFTSSRCSSLICFLVMLASISSGSGSSLLRFKLDLGFYSSSLTTVFGFCEKMFSSLSSHFCLRILRTCSSISMLP